MGFLLPITIASAFVPYSIMTPIGFISLVDLCVGFFFAFGCSKALYEGKTSKFNALPLILSFLCFSSIMLSGLFSPINGGAGTLLKYAVFLLIIPLALVGAGLSSHNPNVVRQISTTLRFSGMALSVVVLAQILRGHTETTGDGVYYIHLGNEVVNKNTIGQLLVISFAASALSALRDKTFFGYIELATQLAVTFIIGARAAVLVDIGVLAYIAVVYARWSSNMLALVFISGVSLASILAIIWPALGYIPQVRRLEMLLSMNTSELTASSSRLVLWDYAWQQFLGRPVIGHGYETFNYTSSTWLTGITEPHNNLLQILVAGGAVGLVMFMTLLCSGWLLKPKRHHDQIIDAALLAYLAVTMVDIIWLRGIGHIFWLLFFLKALAPGSERGKTGSSFTP